jgi:hypothetical protein
MDSNPFAKKNAFRPFESFQGLGCFSNGIAAHLRAELRKFFSKKRISQMMQTDTVDLGFALRDFCRKTASRTKTFLKRKESLILFLRNGQLDRDSPFHGKKNKLSYIFQKTKKERRFFPTLKYRVSAPSNG